MDKKRSRDEETKKDLIIRMNRIIGSLNGIKNMIEDDRYCVDILNQLAASSKAIRSLSDIILEDHIKNCLVKSIKEDDLSVIDEMIDLSRRF